MTSEPNPDPKLRTLPIPPRLSNRLERLRRLAEWSEAELTTWVADELEASTREAIRHLTDEPEEDGEADLAGA